MIARLPQRMEPLAHQIAVEEFRHRGQGPDPHRALRLRNAEQLRDVADVHQRRLQFQLTGLHLRHHVGAARENRDVSGAQNVGRFGERSGGGVALYVGHSRYL